MYKSLCWNRQSAVSLPDLLIKYVFFLTWTPSCKVPGFSSPSRSSEYFHRSEYHEKLRPVPGLVYLHRTWPDLNHMSSYFVRHLAILTVIFQGALWPCLLWSFPSKWFSSCWKCFLLLWQQGPRLCSAVSGDTSTHTDITLESIPFLYEIAKCWELEGHTGSSSETHKTLQHLTVCCLSPPYWHFLLLLLKIRHPILPFREGESKEGSGWGLHTPMWNVEANGWALGILTLSWCLLGLFGHKCLSVVSLPFLIFHFPCNSPKKRKTHFTEYQIIYWFGHILGICGQITPSIPGLD